MNTNFNRYRKPNGSSNFKMDSSMYTHNNKSATSIPKDAQANGSNMPPSIEKMFNKYGNSSESPNCSNSKNTSNSSNSNFSNTTNNFQNNNMNFQDLLSNFMNSNSSDNRQNVNDNSNPFGNIDIGTIMKFKGAMDKMNAGNGSPRSTLLRSLKPYLSSNKQQKLDQYIGLMNMEQVIESLGILGR